MAIEWNHSALSVAGEAMGRFPLSLVALLLCGVSQYITAATSSSVSAIQQKVPRGRRRRTWRSWTTFASYTTV